MTKEIRKLIKGLKTGALNITDIPWEYENDPELVAFERKKKLREANRRGYDVIEDKFFVEDRLVYKEQGEPQHKTVTTWFKDFEEYYRFLCGDCHTNACYAFLPKSRTSDADRLLSISHPPVTSTIRDYTLSPTQNELDAYQEGERIHKECVKWQKRFSTCKTYRKLRKTASKYLNSDLSVSVGIDCFLSWYVFDDPFDKQRAANVVRWLCSEDGRRFESFLSALCRLYGTGDIRSCLLDLQEKMETTPKQFAVSLWDDIRHWSLSGDTLLERIWTLSVIKDTLLSEDDLVIDEMEHRIQDLDSRIQRLQDGELELRRTAGFDPKTHYYYERVEICDRDEVLSEGRRYFERFGEFISYWGNDLSGCDFSGNPMLEFDLSECIIDDTTKTPSHLEPGTTYQVIKKYEDGQFFVTQRWSDRHGRTVKEYRHVFPYFMDFAAFLEQDFRGADLLFCEGLENLDPSQIDLTGAVLTSKMCDHFGLPFKGCFLSPGWSRTFAVAEENETRPKLVMHAPDEPVMKDIGGQAVYYVSDLHINHRLSDAGCRSANDLIYTIHTIARGVASQLEEACLLCIAGDTASDFRIFATFAQTLKQYLPKDVTVVFTLGNHELWGFPNMPVDRVAFLYRQMLQKHGMYLLQNDLLYRKDKGELQHIPWRELLSGKLDDLERSIAHARYILFGGIGFSGYNETFNAEQGIYQDALDRGLEKQESKKTELIYRRVAPILKGKNVVVLTHMPKEDWYRGSAGPHIYIHGHTHQNIRLLDGQATTYADAQAGYHQKEIPVGFFRLDDSYDYFDHYGDGIHEVTKRQYGEFYSGKNLSLTFPAQNGTFYMLKKKGYYCFLHQLPNGSLGILNGGSRKHLKGMDVDAYYKAMGRMVDKAGTAFDRFTSRQAAVSKVIRDIGGTGEVHGPFVDIDKDGSIHVDPKEGSLSGYWADGLLNRAYYPSVLSFLKAKYPQMYEAYHELYGDGGILSKYQLEDSDVSGTLTTGQVPKLERTQRLDAKIINEWNEDMA